ncbi:class I SAM-dependent methyltransferase [Spirillospora sp. CA-142024]|uniref:class I SAM-dependent methyltransferase n=1 Tax=Spirillospora sp. CA-142024 TaxID=3240036 RepID=UPI003D8BE84E
MESVNAGDDAGLGEAQRRHWEATYATHPGLYGGQPSVAAVDAAAKFAEHGVRSVLELGAGHGRDALFFARSDFDVHASDFSPVSLAQLAAEAVRQGVADKVTTVEHDARHPLPFTAGSFDAVYAHMLLCMALSTQQIHSLVHEVRRILRPGGIFVYTVRHTGDAHYGRGITHGDDIYEHGGFAVHFFSRTLVDDLADGWILRGVHPFAEGDLPRRLWRVTQTTPER